MGKISAMPARQPLRARADRLATGLLLGVAMALAVPSTTWAQNRPMTSQPPGEQHPSSGGSTSNVWAGSRYRGVLTHVLHVSGPTQSQGRPPGPPPSAPHRSSKPPL